MEGGGWREGSFLGEGRVRDSETWLFERMEVCFSLLGAALSPVPVESSSPSPLCTRSHVEGLDDDPPTRRSNPALHPLAPFIPHHPAPNRHC